MRTQSRIAVVGAGPGGLTLARVLYTRGLTATVYERDPAPAARDQGGTLDLHADSGQLALAAAGLLDDFRAVARPEGQELRLVDKHAGLWLHEPVGVGGTSRPEVDRGALRDILLASLPPGTVRWGRRVVAAATTAGGRPAITLDGGEVVEADLLVGADGAWSKIRPLVSAANPVYSGLSFVETHLADADSRHPAAAALVGRGTLIALSDERGLIAQRNGDGSIRVYAAIKVDKGWAASGFVDPADPDGSRRRLLALFAGWDEGLRGLIAGGDDRPVPRPIYALPVGQRWARVSGVTLLGDAAHLMSPFAGEGANLAMLDGAELARAVCEHADLDAALDAYEPAMFARARAAAAESAENLVDFFRREAPRNLLEKFARYAASAG